MRLRPLKDISIRAKLMIVAMLTSVGALLLAAGGFTIFDIVTFKNQKVASVMFRAEMVAQSSTAALEFNDRKPVVDILAVMRTDKHMAAMIVYDTNRNVFASYVRPDAVKAIRTAPPNSDGHEFGPNRLTVHRRISYEGRRVGTVLIESDLGELDERMKRHAGIAGLVLLASIAAALFLSAWLQRLISGPLLALSETARSVAADKNYSLRASRVGNDEVGRLVDGFNEMLTQIQARDGALQQAQNKLEQRVTDRTLELQAQVNERRRAEDALRESQSLYSSLVEHLPIAVYRKDAAGKLMFGNKFFWQILRRTPEEFFASPEHDDTPPELAAQYHADHRRVMSEGITIEVEEQVQTRTGELLQVHAMKVPAYGSDGVIKGTQGCFLDITDRKRMEKALAYERDLLRTLLDHSPDHIYFKDKDSRFLRCSHALLRRLGLRDHDDVLGKADHNFFHVDHASESLEDEKRIMATGEPVIGKVEREVWADGSVSWVLTSKMPYRDKSGEIIGTFGISKDMTLLKTAEAELERANRQLVTASRQAGMAEVATGVLHNVGNVLNSVNVSTTVLCDLVRRSKITSVQKLAQWLRNDPPDAAVASDTKAGQLRDYVAKLSEHLANEQRTLLDELTLLSEHVGHMKEIVAMQQNYAKVSGVSEPLPASSLVEDALRMNSAALSRHDVHVQCEFAEVPRVLVDRHKVLQILINLISNAKYALDAGMPARKTLTIRIQSEGERVAILLIDNGVGIVPENLTQIFHHGFTTRKTGHGFGLHSSALAARELGGALRVQSDGPGRGATFVLELPVEPSIQHPPSPYA